RAEYQPPPEIVKLNGQYPRTLTRNWGHDQGEWAITAIFDDIALGTAGAKYEGMQDMVQTVDIADQVAGTPFPRSYFIADGRNNPYGIERSPSGSGGQQKALHLDALWFGTQRTVDSLGLVLYPPAGYSLAIAEPGVVNVQSHFVVRKPESIWINDQPISLLPHQPVKVGNQPVVFRYETCAFGLRAVWTRHQNGQPAEVFLVNDDNEYGVYRLTVEHGEPVLLTMSETMAGAAFWVRIGSNLITEDQFSAWRQEFMAEVPRINVEQNNIAISVTGQDGIVSINRTDSTVTTDPDAPMGILTLNGKDLGRTLLEKIPAVATFAKRQSEAKPIVVNPSETHWKSATGYSFYNGVIEPDETARINHDLSWQLQVEQPGVYFLWGRVQTLDPEHDSFFVETAKQLPDGSFMRRSMNADWHLGTRADWTWVRLEVPIRLEKGIWQLTLKPREYEGRIDQLFLTNHWLMR
ncbi:MAG: hypothetical protein LBI05_03130, partial [Planctomycetaceae bacterium]|nr:hypothetical protein [Planctomycetaceae bacterium]